MLTEWNELEIDFGRERIRFIKDLPPAEDIWKEAKDWAASVLNDKIEREVRDAFLLFSEKEREKLCYLKGWIGRKYRYFLWGGLLRVFLVYRTGGKSQLVRVRGEDVLGIFSDDGYRPFQESGFENGTAIFPAYYQEKKTGKKKKTYVMLRVMKPFCGGGIQSESSVPIIREGQEIAQGHFEDEGRLSEFCDWRCELICQD